MEFISQAIEAYARQISTSETPVLERLNRDTHARILRPRMLSGHLQGKLLELISHMMKPARILEIGTYTGYSAICLATGLAPNGILHTIDHNPELEDFSMQYFKESGLGDRIIRHTGEALDVIPTIDEVFDIVFIDADKENYIRYFDMAFEKLRRGGIIIADNVLWSGKVVEYASDNLREEEETQVHKNDASGIPDSETLSIIRFNEYIRAHKGVNSLLLPFRDGLMICLKT